MLPDGLDKTQPLLATAAKNALAMAAVCSASTAVHWKDEGGGGEGETEEETAAFAHKAQQASEDAARLIGELAQASRDRVAFVVKHALAATAAVMETGQQTWQSLEAWGKGRVADECAAVSRACRARSRWRAGRARTATARGRSPAGCARHAAGAGAQ